MTDFSSSHIRPLASPFGAAFGLKTLWGALAARRSRRQLKALDAHILNDIGLSARAARTEADRPIWDVPAHWTE